MEAVPAFKKTWFSVPHISFGRLYHQSYSSVSLSSFQIGRIYINHPIRSDHIHPFFLPGIIVQWNFLPEKDNKINVSDILRISFCENFTSQFFILDNFPFFFSPFSSLLLFFSLLAVPRLLVGWQMAAPQDNLSDLCCKNSPHHSSFSSALQVTS